MTTSESINELASALSKAQGEMEGATKGSANPFFKSRYPDLKSVRDACIPALTKYGLAILQAPTTDGAKVSVETLLLHSSGQWIRDTLTCTAKDDGPQAVGSCITYLRRYSLQSFAGVAPEDDDGEAAEGRGNGKTQKPVLVPQVPQGYGEWLTGFTTAAEGGLESMRAFWRESPQTMRDHVMQTASATVDRLKAVAEQADLANAVASALPPADAADLARARKALTTARSRA